MCIKQTQDIYTCKKFVTINFLLRKNYYSCVFKPKLPNEEGNNMEITQINPHQYSIQHAKQFLDNTDKSNVSFGLKATNDTLKQIRWIETNAEQALSKHGQVNKAKEVLKAIGIIKAHLKNRDTDDLTLRMVKTEVEDVYEHEKMPITAFAISITGDTKHALTFTPDVSKFLRTLGLPVIALKKPEQLRELLGRQIKETEEWYEARRHFYK